MKVKPLYKYRRNDGGITVSPNMPECEYTDMYRLIADEGKVITNDGEKLYTVIDVDSPEGYYEINKPKKEEKE